MTTPNLKYPPPPPSTPATELTNISHLLALTHHRNKNQHRLSKWYKAFSQLRRQVSKILDEVTFLDSTILHSSDKNSKYVCAAREKVEVRVAFWEDFLLERWFVAFSNLTADNQYAALGLMFLGCLARVRSVVRVFSKGDGRVGVGEMEVSGEEGEGLGGLVEGKLDVGEVVRREEVLEMEDVADGNGREDDDDELVGKRKSQKKKRSNPSMEPSNEQATTSKSAKRPKKKRKKGDAFDDLFSSLV